jgi:phosphoglycan beta-1,3-galactosyltransferase
VPQFLRDIRHIRSGFKDAFPEVAPAVRDAPGIYDTEECVYWGMLVGNKRLLPLRYFGGMGYMLHRRMVQATMELTTVLNAKTVGLAVVPFDNRLRKNYEEILFNAEDAFVGRMMRDVRGRLRAMCPFERSMTVKEPASRVADKPKRRNMMGWGGVLLHHVTPFDIYFLHYYFQHEHEVAVAVQSRGRKAEISARKAARRWMDANTPIKGSGGRKLIPMQWSYSNDVPASIKDAQDHVHVYNVSYRKRGFLVLDVAYAPEMP